MDRRFVGIGVIVVALLAMAILPGLVGRSVPGTAVVDPAVPVVGGCVVAPNGVHPRFAGTVPGDISPVVPRASAGSCDSPNAARVLATTIGSDLIGPGDTVDSADLTEDEYSYAQDRLCPDPVTLARPRISSSYQWQAGSVRVELGPVFRVQGALVAAESGASSGPWLACVAESWNSEPLALDLTKAASWDELAACVDAAGLVAYRTGNAADDGTPESHSCTEPHVAQWIGGWRSTGGSPDVKSFQAACRGFAAHVTHMADPTAGGQLRPEWSRGMGTCLLTVVDPTRTLDGSLYGIGDAALPWTR